MLQEDLEKRLEEIESKIEELEDMILDNKLKIMDIFSKSEKKGPSVIKFDAPKKAEAKLEEKEVNPAPKPKKPISPLRKIFKPKKAEPEEIENLKDRAKKIKDMLRELK
ncbi:MAG: hypothetical protein KAT37_04255 [Candidatus Aenigmarchaeota archaeon]|nr:hypothetical protein [Candidatus Aenigmarchaeota archaeon]